ncbi:MAG: hypothetical protein H0U89_01435 [Acidimicrobiia bacterium]|nr:hypothetical protein [Acidimicrobiia bacterium]
MDGDVRAASLTLRLLGDGGRDGPGLAELVEGQIAVDQAVRLLSLSDGEALSFLPAGAPSATPGRVLRGSGVGQAFQALREGYELVIVDCPTLLAVADVPSLSTLADGLLLVVRRGTAFDQLDEVRRRLELLPAPLVGYVFTRTHDGGATPYGPDPTPRRRTGGRRRGASSSTLSAAPAVGEARTNGDGRAEHTPLTPPLSQSEQGAEPR